MCLWRKLLEWKWTVSNFDIKQLISLSKFVHLFTVYKIWEKKNFFFEAKFEKKKSKMF